MQSGQQLIDQARSVARSLGALYINGAQVDSQLESTIASVDPSSGEVWATVQAGGPDDINRAVESAHRCFENDWGKRSPADRERVLRRFVDLLAENADLLATIDSIDSGVVLSFLRTAGTGLLLDTVEYFSGWPTKLAGQNFAPTQFPNVPGRTTQLTTVFEPVGVVGAILPWNAPSTFALTKGIPALAAGCTVVVKPAEQTPLSALFIADLFTQAGLPNGAYNVVNGAGDVAGASLVKHPLVKKITFTGSTEVGRIIATDGGRDFKRMTLELGGKSAFVVMDDAQLELAAFAANYAGYFLNGQFCMCPSRLFVERSVRDAFVGMLQGMASNMKVGPSYADDSTMGPLITRHDQHRVAGVVSKAQSDGAELLYGGSIIDGPGYTFEPTLLAVEDQSIAIAQDETFGPVLGLTTFDKNDMDSLMRNANGVRYGLAASVWTSDLKTGHSLASSLQAGVVSVNDHATTSAMFPFGGVKDSGIGREFGRDGFESFFEKKSIAINY